MMGTPSIARFPRKTFSFPLARYSLRPGPFDPRLSLTGQAISTIKQSFPEEGNHESYGGVEDCPRLVQGCA